MKQRFVYFILIIPPSRKIKIELLLQLSLSLETPQQASKFPAVCAGSRHRNAYIDTTTYTPQVEGEYSQWYVPQR